MSANFEDATNPSARAQRVVAEFLAEKGITDASDDQVARLELFLAGTEAPAPAMTRLLLGDAAKIAELVAQLRTGRGDEANPSCGTD